MERRDALRLLATAAALPFIPRELLAALRLARTETAGTTPRTLNPHQYQTVTRMAEIILPETNTPGATAAHVNDFIDLILTEWYTAEERDRFLTGLQEADARCVKLFGKPLLDLAPEQQEEMVAILDREMAAEIAKRKQDAPDADDSFFHSLKGLTLTGYYTSEAGAKQELQFKIITGHYDGCVPAGETKSSQ
jgi:hypothetical protein